jgi:1-deoxy-D-xylulose-5-phosphate reductoisomerase
MVKNIALLGSTGSIGTQTLEVIDGLGEDYRVVALAAGSNYKLFAKQVSKYKPEFAALDSDNSLKKLKEMIPGARCQFGKGMEGQLLAARWPSADLVVLAQVGFSGFEPLVSALTNGKKVALANKESLVIGGEILQRLGLLDRERIFPVDSEHSAIKQCWTAKNHSEVARIYLTASGGPFYGMKRADLIKVTPQEALRHPNWLMGPKITVDSATMMNKGLEVIEAKWLFGLKLDQISILIHRQSIVHSMVEFVDGSTIAQLGLPDMRTPIQYALTYPERRKSLVGSYNPFGSTLTFTEPDHYNFPAIKLAYRAAEAGGTMPAVLNGANEVAVELFLNHKLVFTDIAELIEKVIDLHDNIKIPEVSDVIDADRWAREKALETGALLRERMK